MGMLIGQKEYMKFMAGKKLTYKEQVLAHCYNCNGGKEGGVDCQGESCTLYQSMPYRDKH
jgi:hypothetical protein